jgi:hypothetical protein
METSNSNVELIDKFIDNERKSKAWTAFTVILFSLMACMVLFFAVKLRSTNKQLDITKDSLELAYDKQDSLISMLQVQTHSSDRNADNCSVMYDSLKRDYDAMAQLFNKTQDQLYKNNTAQATEGLRKISQDLKIDSKVTEQVAKVVVEPKLTTRSGDFLVFMQCMPGYEAKTDKISQLLKRTYKVQPKQVIKDFAFDPGVKYYRDDDANDAAKISAAINASDPFFKDHPVTAKRLTLKTSYHQVEVWIGMYHKQDPKQFLLNSSSFKNLKAN